MTQVEIQKRDQELNKIKNGSSVYVSDDKKSSFSGSSTVNLDI